MEHEPEARNCWAPEIFFDDVKNQYLIFWATTIPGKFPETDYQNNEGKPGEGYNHRMYYVTTKDFSGFSETLTSYDHGFNVIDATLINSGHDYIMFFKDETNRPFLPQKNIRVATSPGPEGPYGDPSPPVTGDYWAEGPAVIRIGGAWHLYFDKYRLRKYGLLVSEDLQNWTDMSDSLEYPAGMRHGTVFRTTEKILKNLSALE